MEQKADRIEGFLKLAIICVLTTGLIMISLITLIPEELANLFLGDSNEQTKLIVLSFAALVWPVFLFNGINLTISAYFTAVHKPFPSASIAISRSLILPVFLSLFYLFF